MRSSQTLRNSGLAVAGAVVLLDREQGGIEKLRAQGIRVFAAFGAHELLEALRGSKGIEDVPLDDVLNFLRNSSPPQPQPSSALSAPIASVSGSLNTRIPQYAIV